MTTKPALLKPFCGVLPPADKAHLVATRSYVTYSDYELKDKLARNPFSYLHVIHPSGEQTPHGSDMQPIREAYEAFVDRGWLERDDQAAYYALRQESPLGTVTGLVGLVPVQAVRDDRIKVHESTLSDREVLFANYLAQVGLNAEPALLGHAPSQDIATLTASATAGRPDMDFTTADGVRHTLWRVVGDAARSMESSLDALDAVYIADGHHRVASSLRMADAHPEHTAAQHFMALLVPGDQLVFRGYHRIVNLDRHALEPNRVKSAFDAMEGVRWIEGGETAAHGIQLRGALSGTLVVDADSSDVTLPEWLQDRVLGPVFGILEPRTDKRLRCVTDDQLTAWTAKEGDLAFVLPPLDFDGLKSVADAGRHMPPKSTWIAPKLRSGLALFDFGPAE